MNRNYDHLTEVNIAHSSLKLPKEEVNALGHYAVLYFYIFTMKFLPLCTHCAHSLGIAELFSKKMLKQISKKIVQGMKKKQNCSSQFPIKFAELIKKKQIICRMHS